MSDSTKKTGTHEHLKQSYNTKFRGERMPTTNHNLRSVTNRQLITAAASGKLQGRLVISNSLVYTVRICGRIVLIDQHETHTDYVVDDGTGALEGRIWQRGACGVTDLNGASLGAYYMVVAAVQLYDGKIMLQTLAASQVVDHNTVTMHLLDAINQHCLLTQLSVRDVTRWGTAVNEAKKSFTTALSTELNKEAIIDVLDTTEIRETEAGATSEQIIEAIQVDKESGWVALQSMLDEGSVYNTIDYNHFKLAHEN